VLKVENLKVGSLPALSFEVARGECLAVEGPSGTGKTRLLRAIADLDQAPGYVSLDGASREEMSGPEWRKRVRYFSAEPGWWAATPREHFPLATPEAEPRLLRLLHAVGLEAEVLDLPVAQLSTGQRIRLALVRGLLDEPSVLLFDEPTGALDPASAALVAELIRFQLLAGRIVLLVSHNPDEVARLAHQRLLLGAPSAKGAVPTPSAAQPPVVSHP
jgi:ABC-type multidrug transport system ATPase subunit